MRLNEEKAMATVNLFRWRKLKQHSLKLPHELNHPIPSRKLDQPEPSDLQQNLQQRCSFGSRLALGCLSVGIVSPKLTVINHFITITYNATHRSTEPKVTGSNPVGRALNAVSGSVSRINNLLSSIIVRYSVPICMSSCMSDLLMHSRFSLSRLRLFPVSNRARRQWPPAPDL